MKVPTGKEYANAVRMAAMEQADILAQYFRALSEKNVAKADELTVEFQKMLFDTGVLKNIIDYERGAGQP